MHRLQVIFLVAVKRIISQPGLAVATSLGFMMAVALAMSIPIYADAVYYRAFVEKLASPTNIETARPPFSFAFTYSGSGDNDIGWEGVKAVDQYLSSGAAHDLGLPQKFVVRQFKTGTFDLFARDDTRVTDPRGAPVRLRFGVVGDLADHITLVEGALPNPAPEDGAVEALVTEKAAADFDLQAGETFFIRMSQRAADGTPLNTQVLVRISGIWMANNPFEDFWFTRPAIFIDQLLIPEISFAERIVPYLSTGGYVGEWFVVGDGDHIDYSAAAALIQNITRLDTYIRNNLPGTRMMVTPRSELEEYVRDAQLLTVQLYAFGVPIIGLLLAFISLTAALAMERRRNEIAVLRSRGATLLQVVGVGGAEALLLGGISLLIAMPLSLMFAGLIGRARSFLDFSGTADLRLVVTPPALTFGLIVIALALTAQIVPTVGAARFTVTTYKQNRARLLRPPWWQRTWLDVLLFIPAAYGGFLLAQQGNLTVLETNLSRNPFENPLLFLVPALGILALTLFFLRLLPFFMSIFAWLTAQTPSVSLLIATRHLARTPGFYNMPLILLVLTLSLSAFTATLAETLNHHLRDEVYYALGTDAKFADFGIEIADAPVLSQRYAMTPVSFYLQSPGVYGAARVGQYNSRSTFAGRSYQGKFLAIDRFEFPQVAFWRRDFASQNLVTLMNGLAANADAVLVPREFMNENGLEIGTRIQVTVDSGTTGIRVDVPFTVAGTFELFPTWYPAEGPLFVGNLDYVFERAGGDFPYYVWLDVDPGFTASQLVKPDTDTGALNSPQYQISKTEQSPERQGLFGLLSVGFVAAAVLTVLGFLLYVLFSFRQRYIEMGVLRALGLSTQQLVWFLVAELAFVIFTGGIIGTALGALVSAFFIPHLQIGVGESANVPPFIVEIAWGAVFPVYILFGWLFVLALSVLVFSLRRMRIFQAIKLGETV